MSVTLTVRKSEGASAIEVCSRLTKSDRKINFSACRALPEFNGITVGDRKFRPALDRHIVLPRLGQVFRPILVALGDE